MPKQKQRQAKGKSSKSKERQEQQISNVKSSNAKRKARRTPGAIKKIISVPFINKPKKPALGKPKGTAQTITGNAVTLVSKYVATAQEVTMKVTGINSGVTKEIKVTINPK